MKGMIMGYQGVRIAGILALAAMLAVTGCKSKAMAGEQAKKGAEYGEVNYKGLIALVEKELKSLRKLHGVR